MGAETPAKVKVALRSYLAVDGVRDLWLLAFGAALWFLEGSESQLLFLAIVGIALIPVQVARVQYRRGQRDRPPFEFQSISLERLVRAVPVLLLGAGIAALVDASSLAVVGSLAAGAWLAFAIAALLLPTVQ